MNECPNQIKIFELIEGDIIPGKEKSLYTHIKECNKCRKIYESYANIKLNINTFYNSVDLDPKEYNFRNNGEKTKSAVSLNRYNYAILAASIVLGFLLIYKGFIPKDYIYESPQINSVIMVELDSKSSISEWDLEVYTISNKIELIRNQLNENIIVKEKAGEK